MLAGQGFFPAYSEQAAVLPARPPPSLHSGNFSPQFRGYENLPLARSRRSWSLEILGRPHPIHVFWPVFGGFSAFLPVAPLNLARQFEKLDCFQKSPRKSAREPDAVGVPMPV
ncbi:hypothetical protein HK16_13490 [Acetobacter senegalensis]|uniref:Uncharacterized protein n=2 Tax=Acetobacter TaxID=434 RepID=A0A252EHX5_9PROT|nr:hypothetical protein CIW82_04010 [Acetobacter tropicalis]KGB24491.1 hypothetical protein AtDm6_1199 [Acetobacter tropicalis]OUL65892.1 hypothetical protein HK16_13490 [Acetobacter senegalensis]